MAVLYRAASFQSADISNYAWSNLRSFDHVSSTCDQIVALHKLDKAWIPNARKQAENIRACLIQAREYRDAFLSVSLATKPVLLYYCCMSLALAQVLFKGTGDQSLEVSRSSNAHHGLIFSLAGFSKKQSALEYSANALRARPLEIQGGRKGTFELWHELSREDPLIGSLTRRSQIGGTVQKAHPFFTSSDKRFGALPNSGISFFDILQACPSLYEYLVDRRIVSKVVKATAQGLVTDETSYRFDLVMHPHQIDQYVEDIKSRIFFEPRSHTVVDVRQLDKCFTLVVTHPLGEIYKCEFPPSAMLTTSDIRFIPSGIGLNEFGIFYCGLFMLSNLARYYPDIWMKEVETYSPLADAANNFIENAERRIGLLTLSDLSQKYYVADD